MSHSDLGVRRAASKRKTKKRADTCKSERELAQMKEALSNLERRSVRERDAQREAIARELHDKIGQYLTIMELELNNIGSQAGITADIRNRILGLRNLIADAHGEIGTLALEIRPASLNNLDLGSAAKEFVEEWKKRSTLSFDIHLSLGKRELSSALETTLFRVLQEAVTNVEKHAGATRVGIILQAMSNEVRLIVEDNGSGFHQKGLKSANEKLIKLGLLGIRERLTLVGGTLEIESMLGRGTTLLVSVPL
jgi:signal transduction histidine kinase